jgi:hypothetical protein
MRSKINTALIASLSVCALAMVANAASASSKSARGAFASAHRPGNAHSFRHDRRSRDTLGWIGDGGVYYGSNGGELAPPVLGEDPRYSDTNDIPWDWAHRYPPAVLPSDRPYVSSCGSETVTVPDGRGGNGQVNIMRCY